MDEVELSTVVYLPPAEVYEFLVDFQRYANYSKYLTRVHRDGDGGPGTRYYLRFSWWKLEYTAHSRVCRTDPPERVDWELVKDIDAAGHWHVEEVPGEAPPDRETASLVTLNIEFDAASTSPGALDLPSFVSLSSVIDRAKPLVRKEAERVVERIVADLEGEQRPVDLTFHSTPDTV